MRPSWRVQLAHPYPPAPPDHIAPQALPKLIEKRFSVEPVADRALVIGLATGKHVHGHASRGV